MNRDPVSKEPAPQMGREPDDPFVSGDSNRFRDGAVKAGTWLFSPPYLPAWSVWVAMLSIALQGLFSIMQQIPNYWIDPKYAIGPPFVYSMLSTSLWIFIVVYLVSSLLVGLLLSVLNRVIGLFVWIGICLYHLDAIVGWGWCGFHPFFMLNDLHQCNTFQTGLVVFISIILGVALAVTIHLLSSGAQDQPVQRPPFKALAVVSVLLTLLMVVGIVRTTILPKPVWHQVQSLHAPTPRTYAALSYDSARKTAVLFGGSNYWEAGGVWGGLNDTWEWNGSDWRQMETSPAQNPPGRFGPGMAYDPKRGVTVLFGGQAHNAMYADTWEWDGVNWRQVFPDTSPPARCNFGMFFDPQRQAVVIYGGYGRQDADPQATEMKNIFYDDAWEWDGQNWTRIELASTRAADLFPILYDGARQVPVMMDGEGLWYLQDNRWQQHDPGNEPPPRWSSQLVYDPDSKSIVLFGGSLNKKPANDTWVFDGRTWKPVVTAEMPATRYDQVMFYDETRRSFLMFGGYDGVNFYGDTWELRLP